MSPLIPVALILLALITVIAIRTIRFRLPAAAEEKPVKESTERSQAALHLSKAITFRTINTGDDETTDWEQFEGLARWIDETYPLCHAALTKRRINSHTLHFVWEGTDEALEPILLTAHQDVVPTGERDKWRFDPFEGRIEDGYLWGRGTLDVKIQIVCILEAIETLLAEGYTPERSVHLCFGHDEEIGGYQGASKAASLFEEEGLSFCMLLDEGGAVTVGMLPGIDRPIATIGVGEKGYMDIKLSATSNGGHASMPQKKTALSTVARATARLQAQQMSVRLTEPVKQMFLAIGPAMPLANRIVISNLWLFKPLFLAMLAKTPSGNSMIRTTFAATMASGSQAPNVLPATAHTVFNIRILHGNTTDDVLGHAVTSIADNKVEVSALRAENPSSLSPTSTREFSLLKQAVSAIFPEAIVTPYLLAGGSDARKYEKVCSSIYRFSPFKVDSSELSGVHSYNERISLDNISRGVTFFIDLVRNTTGA